MKAVGYIRVSTAGQVDGFSLDAQERLFRELCKNRGWELVRIYREEGKSAHVDSIKARPVFRQLLEDAAQRQFDVVVVHTLDRWSRNLKVTLESVSELGKHHVGLVSITEQIDYSTPQGLLQMQMMGAFAQYYSDSLAKHVKKGLDERARQGKRNGGIPYGYESCWVEADGKRKRRCEPEHPGGVHVVPHEAEAVTECFRRYANGTTTLSQLATRLNEQGLRTRNTHKLPGPDGTLTGGPRLFTIDSLKVILHNPFYAGKFRHGDALYPGAYEPIISQEVFDRVKDALRRNCGRSTTLAARPQREYLLKGLIRCASCKMPLWSQTFVNGRPVYREHRGSRSHGVCAASGGLIGCETADGEMGRLMEAIELRSDWLEGALAKISVQDEVKRVKEQRHATLDKFRRLGRAYSDALISDEEYVRRKRQLEQDLESLVVPQANAAEEAGRLLKDLPRLWRAATLGERRKLLLTMLDGVYFDMKHSKTIVAIKPKAPFRPVFQVATTKEGSGIELVQEEVPGQFRKSVFQVETGGSCTPSRTREVMVAA